MLKPEKCALVFFCSRLKDAQLHFGPEQSEEQSPAEANIQLDVILLEMLSFRSFHRRQLSLII